ncbi:MAG: phosphotransferase family protein [Pirellulaceae bacterium]
MLDHAGPIRTGEQLDRKRLEAFLRGRLPGGEGPFTIEQFPCGHSNLTYLLRFGDQSFVLRRPPFGNPVKSAHDMGREFRVLSKLCEVYPPAPRPYVHCQDHDVIGDEFYVMERRSGVVLRDGEPPPQLASNPQSVRRLCESLVDNLAVLHSLDYTAAGLGDLGRPDGYIERQVLGWVVRYENARTDDYPDVERLGQWLSEHRPADGHAALIHNDYKYDNLMLAVDDVTRIVAVLDWEMATVGDALMDLGMTLAYWIQADDPEIQKQGAFGPTMLAGSMTRKQVVERYTEQTGTKIPNMLFYFCFGLFKLTVIVQQIYARFARGLTKDSRFSTMNQRVAALGKTAVQAIQAGEI